MLQLDNVSFGYPGKKIIFNNLNLQLGKEKIGLVGPNGSGKTTLFHLIMGIIHPMDGKRIHRGKKIENKRDLQIMRQDIGLLFQDSDDQLFSPTVWEDVCFGPLNLKLPQEEVKRRGERVLEQLGIADFKNRITHQLSGGEKKLVALATILVMKPTLLLLDEPTNNLDPVTQQRLVTILQELPQGLFIISHDLDFLAQVTDKFYTIEAGEINTSPKVHLHQHSHIHTAGDLPHSH